MCVQLTHVARRLLQSDGHIRATFTTHPHTSMIMATSSIFVPQDAALTRFAGFIHVGAEQYKVCISGVRYASPSKPRGDVQRMLFDHAKLEAEAPLASILARHDAILKVRLMQATSLDGFVRELEELVQVSGSTPRESISQHTLPSAAYYNRLMEEIDAVGWGRLIHLSDDLTSIELQTQDAGGRNHSIRVTLSPKYPHVAPICAVDAPAEFQLSWPVSSTSLGHRQPTLRTLLDQFESFLSEFQPFWNVLEDIDATCCVLEPQHPSRSTGRRRIALQRHVSVQVEIDPNNPRGICDLKFFGSEATVVPLRDRWSEHLLEWEEHRSVTQNLEILLDVELPSPRTSKTEEFALECGICYCYRLEVNPSERDDQVQSVIPDRLCENPKCNRPFHEKCLFDWLKALPTARQSFSTVFGECPYCREALSAKFVS